MISNSLTSQPSLHDMVTLSDLHPQVHEICSKDNTILKDPIYEQSANDVGVEIAHRVTTPNRMHKREVKLQDSETNFKYYLIASMLGSLYYSY